MNMVPCTLVLHFVMFDEGGWVGGGGYCCVVVSGAGGGGVRALAAHMYLSTLCHALSIFLSPFSALLSVSSLLFMYLCVGVCVSLFAYLCRCNFMLVNIYIYIY